MKKIARISLAVGALAVATYLVAQPATPAQKAGFEGREKFGTMHLQSNLGSYRSIDGEGRLETTFKGTLLVSKLDGKMNIVSGKLRKEYEGLDRVVYTGQATVVFTGKWRAIQWFGSDMRTVWYGSGFMRISGEFDKNMKTGDYWYDNPAEKLPFPSSSVFTLTLPRQVSGADQSIVPQGRKSDSLGGE